jgi:hypothetical protein
MGLVVTLVKSLIDWYNQPTLEIVEIIRDRCIIPQGETFLDHYPLDTYFLRMSNTRRKGAAEACQARLVVQNTPIRNVSGQWRNPNNDRDTTRDISTVEDLMVFTVVERFNQIFFPSAHLDEHLNALGAIERQFNDFIHRELEVRFGSKTGRFLRNPYRKKLQTLSEKQEWNKIDR